MFSRMLLEILDRSLTRWSPISGTGKNGDSYEFICIWVDDILITSKRNETIHDDLKKLFKVKVGEFPSYYLGADLEFVEDPTSGEMVLCLSCRTYLKNVIPRIEE